ncbi:hypothetical protein [Bradyrhizobium sp. 191]|uniref:hypothetical protein n=1 Tax=Bradyrhizobium sp. 191 TaxID=2782659 RepID=UPI001FFE7F6F|nr:hypothetical protein [Bradyrhizobium sp. 191]UPJ66698.1 hypothetical protein IVB23_04800 [Bradyrhizobium sp. 191]
MAMAPAIEHAAPVSDTNRSLVTMWRRAAADVTAWRAPPMVSEVLKFLSPDVNRSGRYGMQHTVQT